MSKVIERRDLAENIFMMKATGAEIAAKRLPGQFVVIRMDEKGERFPVTICDADPAAGTITLVVQVAGASTARMALLKPGDEMLDLVGPLGKPTEIKTFGTVVCVGGGAGIAPLYPIARGMRAAGNKVVSILGARTAGLLILKEMMQAASDELVICTDDGTAGTRGFTSNALEALIKEGRKIDLVMAVGPVPMMRSVSNVTKARGIRTVVSLNPIMLDGTGMCGCCRVTVGGQTKFACVDGPEFDAHQVDFDGLAKRLRMYARDEKAAQEAFDRDHKPCWRK
jgi:ferredoxin--NADP+ reductase